MKRVEAAIQKAVIRYVNTEMEGVMITATANELSYTNIDQIGSIGIPDLLLFTRDDDTMRLLFLELKSKKGKLRPTQKEWATKYWLDYAADNTSYGVAYGFLDAIAQITTWKGSLAPSGLACPESCEDSQ